MRLPTNHGWVHESQNYRIDDVAFTGIVVGAVLIILLLIKHWRTK